MDTIRAYTAGLLYLTCLWASGLSATPAPFFSCTDYHCDEGRDVSLSPAQWQAVTALFNAGDPAPVERERIRAAIALLETQVGTITGTWRDLAKNVAGAGQPGQLDCISESRNTTTYLKLLEAEGLLQWHTVEERQVRHPLIFNVHWSAVIRERHSGERFAVDSWFLDNGQPPYIQPLDDWRSGRRFDRRQKHLGDQ